MPKPVGPFVPLLVKYMAITLTIILAITWQMRKK
jgi:hypothetical protein